MLKQMKAKYVYLAAAAGALGVGYLAWRRARAMDLEGRVAIITGGSRGLGLALGRALASRGAHVVLLARHEAELVQAKRQLDIYGGQVLTFVCDVTNKSAVDGCVAACMSQLGHVDILINCAGQIQVGPLEDMAQEDFETALGVHVRGPLHTMLAVVPAMREQGGGSIVNIASFGGVIAVPHMAPYSASKFGLVGLSDAMRTELAADNIRVTTVCPGLMRTGSHTHAQFKGAAEKEYAWFTLANDWPVMSIDADEAARKIVWAMRVGRPRVDLTLPALLGRMAAGIAPNTLSRLLAAATHLLPNSVGPAGSDLHAGAEFALGNESEKEALAADRNNERFN